MKFKDKYIISKGYEELFTFSDEKDELDYEAHLLMFRFLSEVEKNFPEGRIPKNKDLASKLGVSSSYITQVFNGDKLLNFKMLAKLQKALDITFEIRLRKNDKPGSSGSVKTNTRVKPYVSQLSEDESVYKKGS
jgi:transcriptional regulator with XRE-family HTH domain